MPHTDAELAARAARGDRTAFEALVRAHEKDVYNLALRLSRSREDAFDLSQEIFLRVWRALPGFKGQAAFSTWLYRLAYNLCLDHARKTKRRREQPLVRQDEDGTEQPMEWPDMRYSPESEWDKREMRAAIARAMEQLTPEQRAVLTMREIQGLSYDEIAEALRLPAGTVKSRLARARETLRLILTAGGNFFAPGSSKQANGGESP